MSQKLPNHPSKPDLGHIGDVNIEFVSQGNNLVAYAVVFFTGKHGGLFVWDEISPKFLFNILTTDVNISIRL
ncbi:unnamed protein product [Malus baccata var. baccata]